jgi:hypothetical protein
MKLCFDGRSVGMMERVPVIVGVLLLERFRRRSLGRSLKGRAKHCSITAEAFAQAAVEAQGYIALSRDR